MIRTERLVLRPPRPDDLADVHAILSDPVAMRYWSTAPHATREETQVWLEKMIANDPQVSADFVVEFEGRVIGKAGCWRVPEVGYVLHPDFWGKGLAFEAMKAVIAHAFRRFETDHLMADIDPRNAASAGLLRKLGFRKTGHAANTFCVAGEWSDSDYYRLDRPAAPADRTP
jgi:ribosomal-protein-alanine N-acetyltransferase